MITNDLKNN